MAICYNMGCMQELVHIALAANHRYIRGLKATLASIVSSASDRGHLVFHIFSDGLTDEDLSELRTLASQFGCERELDIRVADTSRISALFTPYKGAYTAFLRLFLPEFLSDLDWVVWADVDTLWFRDVCSLWKERDDAVSLVWCRDLPSIQQGASAYAKWNPGMDSSRYCCSGVMVMNLARLRQKGFVSQASDFAAKWGTPFFVDQDILNACCYGDAKIVDDRWDCLNPDPNWREGVVLHFNGIGAHFNDPTFTGWRPLYEIWFRYYAQVVKGLKESAVCPWYKRLAFSLVGLVYLPRKFFSCFSSNESRIDAMHRTVFFCWLRRKRLWR